MSSGSQASSLVKISDINPRLYFEKAFPFRSVSAQGAMQIDKAKVHALAKKLGALDCANEFDETTLIYPATESWDGIVGKLCDRQVLPGV